MPILSSEPDIYPETLLETDLSETEGMDWYAIYTLSRREKELMRRLRSQQIAHYSPLVPTRKRSPAGRVRTSYLPLFTGYVFVCGSDDDRYATWATGCVSKCLEVLDPVELRQDLQRIRLLVQSGGDLRPEPRPVIGRRAELVSGPMRGAEGTITLTHSQHRLTVLVNFMQQGVSVTVDEADLKFLD